MPPTERDEAEKALEEVVDQVGLYPIDAFVFVQEGLGYTVSKVHGRRKKTPNVSRHVSGQVLCEGLREFAQQRWGLMRGRCWSGGTSGGRWILEKSSSPWWTKS